MTQQAEAGKLAEAALQVMRETERAVRYGG
jgi:hypothetical protein